MEKKLVLIGTGATANIAFQYFTSDSEYSVVGFSVEKKFRDKDSHFDLPVVDFEDIENHFNPHDHCIYVAITFAQFHRLRTG